jgi:hypothetical protein
VRRLLRQRSEREAIKAQRREQGHRRPGEKAPVERAGVQGQQRSAEHLVSLQSSQHEFLLRPGAIRVEATRERFAEPRNQRLGQQLRLHVCELGKDAAVAIRIDPLNSMSAASHQAA